MKVVYGILGIILLAGAFAFFKMTQFSWVSDRVYGYIFIALFGIAGLVALYSAVFVREKEPK